MKSQLSLEQSVGDPDLSLKPIRVEGVFHRRFFGGACLIAAALFTANAHADLITSDAGYSGPRLNLTAYATGSYNFTFGPEPIPGGITFTSNVVNSNSGLGSVLGQGNYGLNENGSFGADAVYAGLDGPSGYMSFLFNAPVVSFGAYLNYSPNSGDDQIIGAYDSGGVLLEEWNLTVYAPISTPGGFNQFMFRGIELASGSISEFRLSGGFILAAATADGTATLPPPPPVNQVPDSSSTIALLGAVLAGLAACRIKVRS